MRPPAASTCTNLFLQHGHRANSFSAAFDSDLQRYSTDDGIVAYSQRFGVTCAFFDPVCSSDALPDVLDDFLAAARPHGRVAFWRVSSETARCLSERGFRLAAYGLDNTVPLHDGFDASGTQWRNLRRELAKARDADVRVEAIDDQASPELWRGLERVNERWLASRARRVPIKRATRRTPLRHEPHCTKVVARDGHSGDIVGWAAFDHLCSDGRLIGGGLSTVRWDPSAACGGIATLLAVDGATLLRSTMDADGDFTLALGESPLAPLPEGVELFGSRRSRYLDVVFRSVYHLGNAVYNTKGLTRWKRKWRAEQQVLYCAVEREPPLRETAAALSLIL